MPSLSRIASFSVAPTVLKSGAGKVTLSATVDGARACVLSSTPALKSMPITVPCGPAISHSLVLPANKSVADRIHTFHLSVSGLGGLLIGRAVTVSVRPVAPKVMSFTVTPKTLPSGGKITLSAKVEHARICVLSSSPALPSMPMKFSCKSAMTHSMLLPANASSNDRLYTFEVSAAGLGGTAKGSAVTVMEEGLVPPTTPTTSTTTPTTTSSTPTSTTTTASAPIVFFPPPPTTTTTSLATVTVTFNANAVGATGTMANEAEPYASATALTANNFSYTGYSFAGWATAANGTGTAYADGASYPFTASATLYAQWTENTIDTVNFDSMGGVAVLSLSGPDGSSVTLPSDTNPGYSFTGWGTDPLGLSQPYYPAGASFSISAGGALLFAQWTANTSYTVSFNANAVGATGTMAPETDNVPTALTLNNFSYTGYSFAGWATAANGTGTAYADGASYPFTASATLYAQWTENTIDTVNFDSMGGVAVLSLSGPDGSSVTLPSDTNPGYSFTGWGTDPLGLSQPYYPAGASFSISAGGALLFAQWTANTSYTVSFNANAVGATGTMAPETDNVPTALTLNNFSYTGYSFAGWATAANGTGTAYADGASYPFTASATLYAQWTENTIDTVNFDSMGGVAVLSLSGPDGSSVTLPSDTNPGYSFTGWGTDPLGLSQPYYPAGASFSISAGGALLFAQWTANTSYTVSFNANAVGATGTMAPETDNVPTALTLNNFSYTGYSFAGWATAANGTGTAYADGASYPFTASATLYAQWTENTIDTVNFDSMGGVAVLSLSGPDGSSVTLPSDTNPGYSFTGWGTDPLGLSQPYYPAGASFSISAGGALLFAQWTANTSYTVSFNANAVGATGTMAPETDNVPTALTLNNFSYTGYSFAGWATAANGTGTAYADGASYPFTASATLYAQWTENTIDTVNFDSMGGVAVLSLSGPDGSSVTLPSDTNPGYSFTGWGTDPLGLSQPYYPAGASFSISAGGALLFAQWTANTSYTVSFNANAVGATGTMAPETDNVPTALTLNNFSYTGYSFAGWATAANGTGTAYADGASYPFTASATLYAQWTENTIDTVNFDSMGGVAVLSLSGPDGSSVTLPSDTNPGYSFTGWGTDPLGLSQPYYPAGASFSISAGGALLFAQWTANTSYTVSFNANAVGATGTMAPETDNVPTALTLNNFSYTGYSFAGWATAANGTGTAYADGASYPFTASATLYAQWTENTIDTVNFDSMGGVAVLSLSGPDGSSVTLPSDTNPGYSFTGWGTDPLGLSQPYYPAGASFSISAGGALLFAQWTANTSYTVSFNANAVGATGTMAPETDNVPTALTLNNFSYTGYSFAGWATAANGTGTAYADGASYPFTASATLYAQWTENTIDTVNFDSMGGVAVLSLSGPDGSSVTLPSDTNPGYSFTGWGTDPLGLSQPYYPAGASFSISAGGALLFAQWTANTSYTVSFNANAVGATGTMAPETDNVPTALTLNNFSYTGYSFAGWATAANGTGTAYADGASYPFTASATLYAHRREHHRHGQLRQHGRRRRALAERSRRQLGHPPFGHQPRLQLHRLGHRPLGPVPALLPRRGQLQHQRRWCPAVRPVDGQHLLHGQLQRQRRGRYGHHGPRDRQRPDRSDPQ